MFADLVGWHEIGIITALAIFLEVFYTNECYQQYVQLYDMTRDLLGFIVDFSFLMRMVIKPKLPGYARLSFRYALASAMVLLDVVEQPDHTVSEGKWLEMVSDGVLYQEEVDILLEVPVKQQPLRLLRWSVEVSSAALGLCGVGGAAAVLCDKKLNQVLVNEQMIVDYISLPVPFQYFHILNVVVFTNTSLWCYKMALSTSPWAVFVFVLAQVIFEGLLDLAAKLSNPFGLDEVDFPNDRWVEEFGNTAINILENSHPGPRVAWNQWDYIVFSEKPLQRKNFPQEGKKAVYESVELSAAIPSEEPTYSYDVLRRKIDHKAFYNEDGTPNALSLKLDAVRLAPVASPLSGRESARDLGFLP